MKLNNKKHWGAAAAIAALLGIILYYTLTMAQQSALAQLGGNWKLASSKGGEVDNTSLVGKPYGVFFGFTHCPEVCPTTLFNMTSSLALLQDDAAKDFRLFFVTVDPERDTVPILNDYLSNFDGRIEALVPTPEQLPVVAKQFHVYYKKQPSSDGEYTMDHTATVFLFDADGKFKSTISYDETQNNRVAKLKNLLANQ